MSIFQSLNLNPKQVQVAKIVGIGFAALLVLSFLYRFLTVSTGGMPLTTALKGGVGMMQDAAYESMGGGVAPSMAPTLSVRNIAPTPPQPGSGTTGSDAEAYETTSYYGSIETGDLKKTCGAITALKPLSYVIFEQANESERNCNFVFKVKRANVEDILTKIKALDPRELTQNTQTIKRVIEDFTSETEILTKKKQSIESTLDAATKAYDEITALAVKTQDAETLAKVIESKLQVLERLTQERIQVNEQLDRLSRAKADQLDRLDYTYFTINVSENKYIDGQSLKDSWRETVRQFVRDINQVVQDVTVGLIALVFFALQYLIYFFMALVIVKFAWKWAKTIWKKE